MRDVSSIYSKFNPQAFFARFLSLFLMLGIALQPLQVHALRPAQSDRVRISLEENLRTVEAGLEDFELEFPLQSTSVHSVPGEGAVSYEVVTFLPADNDMAGIDRVYTFLGFVGNQPLEIVRQEPAEDGSGPAFAHFLLRSGNRVVQINPSADVIVSKYLEAAGLAGQVDVVKLPISQVKNVQLPNPKGRAIKPNYKFTLTIGEIELADKMNAARILKGHTGLVMGLDFLVDNTLVSVGLDDSWRLWAPSERAPQFSNTQYHRQPLYAVAAHPQQHVFAVADQRGNITLWNRSDDEPIERLGNGHQHTVRDLAFSPSGDRLVSVGEKGQAFVWDWQGSPSNPLVTLQMADSTDAIEAVAFHPDGEQFATAGRDGIVRVWRASDGVLLRALPKQESKLWAVAYDSEGGRLYAGGAENTLVAWDTESFGQNDPPTVWQAQKLVGHVRSFLPGRTPEHFFVGMGNGRAFEFRLDQDQQTPTRMVHDAGMTRPIQAMALSKSGKELVTADDISIRVWDVGGLEEDPRVVAQMLNSNETDAFHRMLQYRMQLDQLVDGLTEDDLGELPDILTPDVFRAWERQVNDEAWEIASEDGAALSLAFEGMADQLFHLYGQGPTAARDQAIAISMMKFPLLDAKKIGKTFGLDDDFADQLKARLIQKLQEEYPPYWTDRVRIAAQGGRIVAMHFDADDFYAMMDEVVEEMTEHIIDTVPGFKSVAGAYARRTDLRQQMGTLRGIVASQINLYLQTLPSEPGLPDPALGDDLVLSALEIDRPEVIPLGELEKNYPSPEQAQYFFEHDEWQRRARGRLSRAARYWIEQDRQGVPGARAKASYFIERLLSDAWQRLNERLRPVAALGDEDVDVYLVTAILTAIGEMRGDEAIQEGHHVLDDHVIRRLHSEYVAETFEPQAELNAMFQRGRLETVPIMHFETGRIPRLQHRWKAFHDQTRDSPTSSPLLGEVLLQLRNLHDRQDREALIAFRNAYNRYRVAAYEGLILSYRDGRFPEAHKLDRIEQVLHADAQGTLAQAREHLAAASRDGLEGYWEGRLDRLVELLEQPEHASVFMVKRPEGDEVGFLIGTGGGTYRLAMAETNKGSAYSAAYPPDTRDSAIHNVYLAYLKALRERAATPAIDFSPWQWLKGLNDLIGQATQGIEGTEGYPLFPANEKVQEEGAVVRMHALVHRDTHGVLTPEYALSPRTRKLYRPSVGSPGEWLEVVIDPPDLKELKPLEIPLTAARIVHPDPIAPDGVLEVFGQLETKVDDQKKDPLKIHAVLDASTMEPIGLEELAEGRFVDQVNDLVQGDVSQVVGTLSAAFELARHTDDWQTFLNEIRVIAQQIDSGQLLDLNRMTDRLDKRWNDNAQWQLYVDFHRIATQDVLRQMYGVAVAIRDRVSEELKESEQMPVIGSLITGYMRHMYSELQGAMRLPEVDTALSTEEIEYLQRLAQLYWQHYGPVGEIEKPHMIAAQGGLFTPTFLWTIAEALKRGGVDANSRLLDLGAGSGEVVFVAEIVFGAQAVGAEFEGDILQDALDFEAHLLSTTELLNPTPAVPRFWHGDFFNMSLRELGYTHYYFYDPGTLIQRVERWLISDAPDAAQFMYIAGQDPSSVTLPEMRRSANWRVQDVRRGAGRITLASHEGLEEGVVLEHEPGKITAFAVAPNGRLLATAANDHVIHLWDLETGSPIDTITTTHGAEINHLVFGLDGQTLASGSMGDNVVRIWNVADGALTMSGEATMTDAVWSLDAVGATFVAADMMDNIQSISVSGEAAPLALDAYDPSMAPVIQVSPGSGLMVLGSVAMPDRHVFVRDIQTGAQIHDFEVAEGPVRAVAISPDGKWVAASGLGDANRRHPVYVWDVETGQLVHTFTEHWDEVRALAFSQDSRALLSSGKDGLTFFYNPATGQFGQGKSFIERQTQGTPANIFHVDHAVFEASGEHALVSVNSDVQRRFETHRIGVPLAEIGLEENAWKPFFISAALHALVVGVLGFWPLASDQHAPEVLLEAVFETPQEEPPVPATAINVPAAPQPAQPLSGGNAAVKELYLMPAQGSVTTYVEVTQPDGSVKFEPQQGVEVSRVGSHEDYPIYASSFVSRGDQAQALGRIAMFVEIDGFRGRVPTLQEAEDEIKRQGGGIFDAHDYRVADMARFFSEAGELTPLEAGLRRQLLAQGLLKETADGKYEATNPNAAYMTVPGHFSQGQRGTRRSLTLHEMNHMLYFTNPEFRQAMQELWGELSPEAQAFFKQVLQKGGDYDPEDQDLMIREFVAYARDVRLMSRAIEQSGLEPSDAIEEELFAQWEKIRRLEEPHLSRVFGKPYADANSTLWLGSMYSLVHELNDSGPPWMQSWSGYILPSEGFEAGVDALEFSPLQKAQAKRAFRRLQQLGGVVAGRKLSISFRDGLRVEPYYEDTEKTAHVAVNIKGGAEGQAVYEYDVSEEDRDTLRSLRLQATLTNFRRIAAANNIEDPENLLNTAADDSDDPAKTVKTFTLKPGEQGYVLQSIGLEEIDETQLFMKKRNLEIRPLTQDDMLGVRRSVFEGLLLQIPTDIVRDATFLEDLSNDRGFYRQEFSFAVWDVETDSPIAVAIAGLPQIAKYTEENMAVLADFAVAPEWRGTEVGSWLLYHVLQATGEQHEYLNMLTMTGGKASEFAGAERSQPFYERNGAVVAQRVAPGHSLPEWPQHAFENPHVELRFALDGDYAAAKERFASKRDPGGEEIVDFAALPAMGVDLQGLTVAGTDQIIPDTLILEIQSPASVVLPVANVSSNFQVFRHQGISELQGSLVDAGIEIVDLPTVVEQGEFVLDRQAQAGDVVLFAPGVDVSSWVPADSPVTVLVLPPAIAASLNVQELSSLVAAAQARGGMLSIESLTRSELEDPVLVLGVSA